MNSIIRGTNATIQIKIKEDIDFSQLTNVEMCIYQSKRYEKIELESMKKSLHNTIRNIVTSTVRRM